MAGEESTHWVRACEAWAVQPGEIYRVDLPGVPAVALYCIGERYFATADTCSHGEASLSCDGAIKGGTVVCGWHDGAFDILTGAALELPCVDPIRTFAVEVRGEDLYVAVPICMRP